MITAISIGGCAALALMGAFVGYIFGWSRGFEHSNKLHDWLNLPAEKRREIEAIGRAIRTGSAEP